MRKKIGLALGSGGARGLVHIGVLKTLEKHQIKPDFIAGSSIGSCVGAMYAAGHSAAEIEDKVLNSKWMTLNSFLDLAWKGGVIKGEKLDLLLDSWIGVKTFEKLHIPLTTVAADLISGDEVHFSSGDLIPAVRASMSVPYFFKPLSYKDQLLVDGGIINPVPDDIVKNMGADFIIAVNLDHRKGKDQSADQYKWGMQASKRSLDLARHYLAKHCLKHANIILNPEFREPDLMGIRAYFDAEKVQRYIKMGEKLMEEKISEIPL